MKKLCLVLAALLVLTACGKEKLPPAPVEEPVISEEPVENDALPEQKPVEIPVEVVEPQEEFTEMNLQAEYTSEVASGLLEDAVAYHYSYPVFTNLDGGEKINAYYGSLMEFLSQYASDTVLPETLERHTIADVTGAFEIVAADEGLQLGICYTVTIDFGDGTQESFDRTDVFHPDTGELLGSN